MAVAVVGSRRVVSIVLGIRRCAALMFEISDTAYACAMRCLVLSYASLRLRHAMSGTDEGCGA